MFTPIWRSTTDLKMTVSKYYGKTNSELYDNWTNYHDEIINGIKWQCHKEAAIWIIKNVNSNDAIADLGAGNGEIGIELKEPYNFILDGYDKNKNMLDRFVANNYNLLVQHDIYEKPLPKQYKYIVSTGVFTVDHVDAYASKNLADSLTDDGKLFATMSYSYNGNFLESGGWLSQDDLSIYTVSKPYESMVVDGKAEYHRNIVFTKAEK